MDAILEHKARGNDAFRSGRMPDALQQYAEALAQVYNDIVITVSL